MIYKYNGSVSKLLLFTFMIYSQNNMLAEKWKKIYVFYTERESTGNVKSFDFHFLIHMHVLLHPEHDITIIGKCLSTCPVYNFCDFSIPRTKAWNLIKLKIQLDLDIDLCWTGLYTDRGANSTATLHLLRILW